MKQQTVIRIGKNVKRITLSRVICSALATRMEVDDVMIGALYHNHLWLENKVQRDEGFYRKYGVPVLELSEILKAVNLSSGLTPKILRWMGQEISNRLSNFLLPSRNCKTEYLKLRRFVTVIPYRSQGVPVSQLPPKKVIGKGYGDKGTARDPAQDGNPSWQDVSVQVANLERILEELLEKLNSPWMKSLSIPERIRFICYVNEVHEQLESIKRDPLKGNTSSKTTTPRKEDPQQGILERE